MEEAAASGDREAMWLYPWAAYTLHNVPDMLRLYDDTSSCEKQEGAARRLLALPKFLAQKGAPPRLSVLGERLGSQKGAHEELGLAVDLRDLDLAPNRELDEHLQTLYQFCLETRQVWSWPHKELGEDGWSDCEFQGRNNGVIGRTAKLLPVGLVHWHEFDPSAFKAEVERAYAELKPRPQRDPQLPQ
jgi:hypothetical protein